MIKQYIVKGRVQGVYYRASTQSIANELGLVGWVCNMSDGNVMLQAEGLAKQLKELESWLKQGPANAQVAQVESLVLDDLASLAYDKFIIKPDLQIEAQ